MKNVRSVLQCKEKISTKDYFSSKDTEIMCLNPNDFGGNKDLLNEYCQSYEDNIISSAITILERRMCERNVLLNDSEVVRDFLRLQKAFLKYEVFSVLFLDNSNRLIEFNNMFYGTICAAEVYPRVVFKRALDVHASSVIFAHNHPSGNVDPSEEDICLTKKLRSGLDLHDIRVIDHIIVGGVNGARIHSFSDHGQI